MWVDGYKRTAKAYDVFLPKTMKSSCLLVLFQAAALAAHFKATALLSLEEIMVTCEAGMTVADCKALMDSNGFSTNVMHNNEFIS